jgi:mxaD protein
MNTLERSLLVAVACLAAVTGAAAAGGLSAGREAVVDAPPATVWKLIGNYDGMDVWHPAVAGSALTSGNGVKAGSVRVLTLGDGATVTEPLVAYDARKYSYTYRITKSPLPIKNYTATISLAPAPQGKTLMKWNATFDASGAPDKDAVDTMNGVYDAGLNKVVATFKK